MYGKWVYLFDNENKYEAKVWIWCTPKTSKKKLKRRALKILLNKLNKLNNEFKKHDAKE